MKRLFIAIKIIPQQPLIMMFNNLRNALKYDRITWVDLNNIHITLKFLGDTEEDKISHLLEIVKTTSCDNTPFEITLSRLGLFGSRYNPKVIWCGIEQSPQLNKSYT